MYGEVSRARFESLLVRRLEKIRVGTAQTAKRRIGAEWRKVIDDMYRTNAERLSENQFAVVLNECAHAIVHLMNSIKRDD